MKTRLTKKKLQGIKFALDAVLRIHVLMDEETKKNVQSASMWVVEMLEKKDSDNTSEK